MKRHFGKIKLISKNSIVKQLMFPLILLLVLESACAAGVVTQSGMLSRIRANAADIMHERVNSRKAYLESSMINDWSDVEMTVEAVNQKTQGMLNRGELLPADLDGYSQAGTQLLNEISGDLISMMRNNGVTGAFVVLNHSDLSADMASGQYNNKIGLYFRDLDPNGGNSIHNSDLLIERAPVSSVKKLGLATASSWTQNFDFRQEGAYYPFFYHPFQNAWGDGVKAAGMKLTDLGYWSPSYTMGNDTVAAISYSVPLILKDGTVYGVLGIDITLDYLKTLLPYSELYDEKLGSYLLAIGDGNKTEFENILVNGSVLSQALGEDTHSSFATVTENGREAFYLKKEQDAGEKYYCSVQYLSLYNNNTAFSGDHWALIGVVHSDNLYHFANQVRDMLLLCMTVIFVISSIATVLISYLISRPIIRLSEAIDNANPRKLLRLKRTGIAEIDRLVESMEKMSGAIVGAANKFSKIMRMASAKLAGFEFDRKDDTLFITEGFFDIFAIDGVEENTITLQEFFSYMRTLKRYYQPAESAGSEYVFKISASTGNCFIRLTLNDDGNHCYGLAEDVTRIIRERQVIEHERDHDLLTGLLNRRAFHRTIQELFEQGPDVLQIGALLMMDLDNLKQINDTYGHDYGDQYIQTAAEVFRQCAPEEAIVSRISGDEFYIFYYGYQERQEILNHIYLLRQKINESTLELPDGTKCALRVSGGYTWYPEDSDCYSDLLRYSDFAMYRVKQNEKGVFERFDRCVYEKEANLLQNKAELTKLIDEEALFFHFQPIVEVRTGAIYAYEALMRSNIPTLRMPADILRLAQLEHKLNQIETLTWFKALESFSALVERQCISGECKIFINSIADQVIPMDKINLLLDRYCALMPRVVMELTEEQRMNREQQELKRKLMESYQAGIALDDFGSGYNGEKNLLLINPDYVKMDISIVHHIDRDANKQTLFRNLISYAHRYGMKVVAEGIETEEELRTSIQLGADLLQGFYLARPAEQLPEIPAEIRQKIIETRETEA